MGPPVTEKVRECSFKSVGENYIQQGCWTGYFIEWVIEP